MTLNQATRPGAQDGSRLSPAAPPMGDFAEPRPDGGAVHFSVSRAVGAALAARAAGHPAGADRDPGGAPAEGQLLVLAPARRVRLELMVVADRLVADFAGRWGTDRVLRCVAGCRADLRGSGLTAGLPEAVDRLARERLTEQTAAADGQAAAAVSLPR